MIHPTFLFLSLMSSWPNINPMRSRCPLIRPAPPCGTPRPSLPGPRTGRSPGPSSSGGLTTARSDSGSGSTGQPVNRNLPGMGRKPFLDCHGVVEPAIVAHRTDLAAGVRLDQGHHKDQEVSPALGIGDRSGDLARGMIDAAVDDLLPVPAGARRLGPGADRRPHPANAGCRWISTSSWNIRASGACSLRAFF